MQDLPEKNAIILRLMDTMTCPPGEVAFLAGSGLTALCLHLRAGAWPRPNIAMCERGTRNDRASH